MTVVLVKMKLHCLPSCFSHVWLFVAPWTPPGSSVHGILQARILQWVAIPFSRGSFWPGNQTCLYCIAGRFFTDWALKTQHSQKFIVLSHFSCVRLFVTLWAAAHQAPLSMGFSRQEYASGLPFLPAGDLPNPGIELASPVSPCIGRQILYH